MSSINSINELSSPMLKYTGHVSTDASQPGLNSLAAHIKAVVQASRTIPEDAGNEIRSVTRVARTIPEDIGNKIENVNHRARTPPPETVSQAAEPPATRVSPAFSGGNQNGGTRLNVSV